MNTLSRIILTAPFTALLAACGGGGGGDGTTSERHEERIESRIDLAEAADDPRIVRLQGIVESADTLISAVLYYEGSASIGPISEDVEGVENFTCTGITCTGNDGTEVTLDDELLQTVRAELPQELLEGATIRLGTRGGFDTAQISEDISLGVTDEVTDLLDVDELSLPLLHAFGFWGEHGSAVLAVMDGPLSGRVEGIRVEGEASMTTQAVAGVASGSNPGGLGSATWSGIAEAAELSTFERRKGTATVRIADLNRPMVSVEVNIAGRNIGSDAWNDMALAQGRFTGGSPNRDYLEGRFFGQNHAEAFGVFDTSAYAGAFGAKRE